MKNILDASSHEKSSSLAAEQRTNEATIAPTESMLPHSDSRSKEGAPLDKVSTTSMRTAEVTICIISERLLDRPQQSPHTWRPRLSKTTSTVSLPRVSNVLLMAVYHGICTEPTHHINTLSFMRQTQFPHRERC